MKRVLNVKILNPMLEGVDGPATPRSAGIDLRACINKPITLLPNSGVTKIPLGIAVEPLDDEEHPCVLLLFGRSGLGVKHEVVLANSVGVIDSDYRGELMAGLVNKSNEPYTINPLDRVAQLVILPIDSPIISIVSELSDTIRGTGGFGSTGS